MRITNNNAAFNVWKSYTSNLSNMRTSMAKLSSGFRIRNAGDDPSGLAMSERLRAQSRNTAAAASNVEGKLNYLQTSDSWMQEIHNMLGRMGELAVMANDGTKSAADKDALQVEFKQMQDEISRITTGSNSAGRFNGKALFEGNAITQQVGPDSGQTFTGSAIDLQNTDTTALATGTWQTLTNSAHASAIDIGSTGDAAAAIAVVSAGIDHISNQRADVGGEMKRMSHTLEGLQNYQENLMAAESSIRDVDVAKETIQLSKYSILEEVGIAMLAQANQLPRSILRLFAA